MLRRIALGVPEFRKLETLLPDAAAAASVRCLSQANQPVSATDTAAQTSRADTQPKGLSAVPTAPKVLGLGGVIPFMALSPPIASSLPLLPTDIVANAALLQLGYGASIASFLGGIHWSLAMVSYPGTKAAQDSATDRYIWSVTPCLLAWPALTMASGPGSFIIASVLGVSYMMDRNFASRGMLPAWYMVLRKYLTAGAMTGLSFSIAGSLIAPKDAEQSHSQ